MQDLIFSQRYPETFKSSAMLESIDWKTVAGFSEVHIPSIGRISSPRKSIISVPAHQSICVTSRVTDVLICTPVQKEMTITDFTGIQTQL